jgi:hypothetical protein
MPSLTNLLPRIAPTLRLTTSALYERQRALVRMKLLPTPEGRGRGSGAEATADTVAMLVVSVLATDSLSETELYVQALAKSAYLDLKKGKISTCPFTATQIFVEAVACTLAVEKLAKFRPSIVVSRDTLSSRIEWHRSRRIEVSYFGSPPGVNSEYIDREIRLSFPALLTIKNELRASLSQAPIGVEK